jgi:glycosyltransferase involved in cell wall biosynthesis
MKIETLSTAAGGINSRIPAISVALLIPAYRPGPALIEVVRSLAGAGFAGIIVVDDGSGPEFEWIFDLLEEFAAVKVVRHAVNLGKGAALKTGMNYALVEHPGLAGIVTADADGQHDPADICRVGARFAENPSTLVLGARGFAGEVPLRSRLGNSITRAMMRLVVGQRLSDTQTGLRAIPRELVERMLSVPASGYEFELEMLMAAKHLGVRVIEEPVRTIYTAGNPTSHFDPLRDSMRIYFVLLRFGLLSMTTSLLDNVVFYILIRTTGILSASLLGARVIALTFNYTAVRRSVFHYRAQHHTALPRYLLLAVANVCVSYSLISFLTRMLFVNVMVAKISVETLLFFANFSIQRDFVFARRSK